MNSTIDLRTCVPGQKLRSRNGTILTYIGKKYISKNISYVYPHTVQYPNHVEGRRGDDGEFCHHLERHAFDIVEIIPMEQPVPKFALTEQETRLVRDVLGATNFSHMAEEIISGGCNFNISKSTDNTKTANALRVIYNKLSDAFAE